MYFKFTKIISMLLIAAYIYKKTKDRIALWALSFVLFLIIITMLFRIYLPDVSFGSPTIEYTIFLLIVGIVFIVLIIKIGVEAEKRRSDVGKNISSIFQLSKENIIFWTIIVLINLIGFLLDRWE